jgi:hypothetical protein
MLIIFKYLALKTTNSDNLNGRNNNHIYELIIIIRQNYFQV